MICGFQDGKGTCYASSTLWQLAASFDELSWVLLPSNLSHETDSWKLGGTFTVMIVSDAPAIPPAIILVAPFVFLVGAIFIPSKNLSYTSAAPIQRCRHNNFYLKISESRPFAENNYFVGNERSLYVPLNRFIFIPQFSNSAPRNLTEPHSWDHCLVSM